MVQKRVGEEVKSLKEQDRLLVNTAVNDRDSMLRLVAAVEKN